MSEAHHGAQLLPPNASRLERALSQAAALIHRPEVIGSLWSAATCPAALLPWLAWSLSVDEWDEAWPHERKQQAVLQAVQLHQKKGTPWAVLRALEIRGYQGCELIEFKDYARWEGVGGFVIDHWAQYALRVQTADEIWNAQAQQSIRQTAKRYAPMRSHLVALIGFMRWGHQSTVHIRTSRTRLRTTFTRCTRLTSVQVPVMDGCWLMDATKHTHTMRGEPMDGSRTMRTRYIGQSMCGGQLRFQTRLRMRLGMSLGHPHPLFYRMGRCERDAHQRPHIHSMGEGIAMGPATAPACIQFGAAITLRRNGQVIHQELA